LHDATGSGGDFAARVKATESERHARPCCKGVAGLGSIAAGRRERPDFVRSRLFPSENLGQFPIRLCK
jgi:hypothetical protein